MKRIAKRIALLLVFCAPVLAANLEIKWLPPTSLVEDKTVGYIVQHAGESGAWTNIAFVPVPATNVTLTGFQMGVHQFRLVSTNAVKLVSDPPSNVASTNLVWAPAPAFLYTTIHIDTSRVIVTNVMTYTK